MQESKEYLKSPLKLLKEKINNSNVKAAIVHKKNENYISIITEKEFIYIKPINFNSKNTNFIIEVFDCKENFFLYAFELLKDYDLAQIFNAKTKTDISKLKEKILDFLIEDFPITKNKIHRNFQSEFIKPLENNIYIDDENIIVYYIPGQHLYFDKNDILKESLDIVQDYPKKSRFNENTIKETNSVTLKFVFSKDTNKLYINQHYRINPDNNIIKKSKFDFNYFKEKKNALSFYQFDFFKDQSKSKILEELNWIFWNHINIELHYPFLKLGSQKPKELNYEWLEGNEEDLHKITKAFITTIFSNNKETDDKINYRLFPKNRKNYIGTRFHIYGKIAFTSEEFKIMKKIEDKFVHKGTETKIKPPSEFQLLEKCIKNIFITNSIQTDQISPHNIMDAKLSLNKWLENN